MRKVMAFVAMLFSLFLLALLLGVFMDATTWDLFVVWISAGYDLVAHLVGNAVAALKAVW